MLVLALDTATPAVTTGILRLAADGSARLLAERATVDPRAHGELLMPSVQAVLRDAGVRMAGLDAVVCGVGPGPFTGLRVGMVTAVALGDALGIPVYPVGSLDAIAHRAGPGSALLVVTDARRREVYWARYDETGHRVAGPRVDRPADVPRDGVVRVAGAAAEALGVPASDVPASDVPASDVPASDVPAPDVPGPDGTQAPASRMTPAPRLIMVPPKYPDPAALVAVTVAEVLAGAAPEPPTPLYLRRPDAMEPGPAKRVTPV